MRMRKVLATHASSYEYEYDYEHEHETSDE